MPLIAFKPTKARLIIEQSKDSVLVMKVVAAADERLVLSTGESLSTLHGVLRIREYKPHLERLDRKVSGTLVFIQDTKRPTASAAAKYQINIAMGSKKFDSLLQIAIAGRMPTKFFIDAGERTGPFGGRGITYVTRHSGRVKHWNNTAHPVLPIGNFSMILPIDVAEPPESAPAESDERAPPEAPATSAQVAELADELLAFQAETHYTLKAIVTIIGVILLLAVVFNVVLLYR
jgi:hypothetical protein